MLWNTEFLSLSKEYELHTDGVSAVVSVPDTKTVWTGSFDRKIIVWKLN